MTKEFHISFTPETLEEKLENAKHEAANATDVTPGLAKAMNGKTWPQIFKMLGSLHAYDNSR